MMGEVARENGTSGIGGFSAQQQHDVASEEMTMTRPPRRNDSPAFRAPHVAVAAIKGERTLLELAQDFDVHPNQIKQWRDQLLEGATGVLGDTPKTELVPVIDVKTLHAKIGELALENDAPQGLRGSTGATVPAPMFGALGKAGLLPSVKR